MKLLPFLLVLFSSLQANAPKEKFPEIAGVIRLTDLPPEATPVAAWQLGLQSKDNQRLFWMQPDKDGHFLLKDVPPGNYSLIFTTPGRIESLTLNGTEIPPEDLNIRSGAANELRIVVSLKSTTIYVDCSTAADKGDAVVLLTPNDDRLTLSYTGATQPITGSTATFQLVPPGKYRILVFNRKYLNDVAAYAPRLADFLENAGAAVDSTNSSEANATVGYIPDDVVADAIRKAGGAFDAAKFHSR